ncbi:AI-2E family transporter [Georgenia alba]|uniref:AI-2E family transporter n=1 Tax=Georgenia alba TaxID=2233858 RepID=A0ABW2QGS2_9MICO
MAEKQNPRRLLSRVGRQISRVRQRVRPLRTTSVDQIVSPTLLVPTTTASSPGSTGRGFRPSRASQPSVRRMPDRAVHVDAAPDGVPRWIRTYGTAAWFLIGIVIVVGMVVFATARIQMVFIAVFLALVITSVLYPIVSGLARWMPRPLAVVISLLGSFLVIAGLLTYVVSSVVGQWATLADEFQDGMQTILDSTLTFLEEGPLPVHVTQAEIYDAINSAVAEGTRWVRENAGNIATEVLNNAGAVALVFMILALSLFLTVFFLARGEWMWLWFLNQLPAKNRPKAHLAATAGWYTFSGYARGTAIVAFADGVMAFVLLTIVGVPLAAPLAVLVFIGAFIPLIGAPLAMIIAGVVALAAGGFLDFVIVVLGIALIGQIEGHILQPLVMGKQVSLHPVIVAVGVTAGTFLAGLIGAIIAIPVLAVTWAVYAAIRQVDPPLKDLPKVDRRRLLEKDDEERTAERSVAAE